MRQVVTGSDAWPRSTRSRACVVASLWGQGGNAFWPRSRRMSAIARGMAKKMRAMPGGRRRGCDRRYGRVRGGAARLGELWSFGGRGLGEPLGSDARQRAHRPAVAGDARQDLRSDGLVVRRAAISTRCWSKWPKARGLPDLWNVERKFRRCSGLDRSCAGAARAQHGDARCLDARRPAPSPKELNGRAEKAGQGRSGREKRWRSGRDGEHDAARDAALRGVPADPARDSQGEHRPPARPAGARRILRRDVRLPDPDRARRRPPTVTELRRELRALKRAAPGRDPGQRPVCAQAPAAANARRRPR